MKKFFFYIFFINAFFFIRCDNEKIYAVMITGKDYFHKYLAEKSIQSFLEQTYPNKFLIIVNDGHYSFDHLRTNLIKEIKLKERYVLGKLRNISLEEIPENSIYLQWDDDDWHHPNLIKEQYENLKKNSADMCVLKNQVQYAFKTNSAIRMVVHNGICGTIMCRKKREIQYSEVAKEEDLFFYSDYLKKYSCYIWDNPEYYYLRFIHGNNTWDENHFFGIFQNPYVWAISEESKTYLAQILIYYNFIKK